MFTLDGKGKKTKKKYVVPARMILGGGLHGRGEDKSLKVYSIEEGKNASERQ